jgi:hypothetical protein
MRNLYLLVAVIYGLFRTFADNYRKLLLYMLPQAQTGNYCALFRKDGSKVSAAVAGTQGLAVE